ncbi:MAG: EVE domain-containing protein, partial [Dehalococcoidia bacterium]
VMSASTPRNYWMVAVQPDYYDVCKEQGFSLLGMGRAQRKRVQRMEIGDRVLFYVCHRMVFGAVASVASTYFEDETPTWPSTDPEEPFAWRVKLNADCVMDDEHVIDARFIAPRMEYVKKWAPEEWPLAFQGLLHLVPKKDFGLIEHEMRRGRPRPVVRLGPLDGGGNCVLDDMAAQAS